MKSFKGKILRFSFAVLLIGFIMSVYFIIAFPAGAAEGITWIVKRNETVSYIAMKHYGFFCDSLFQVIHDANPEIKDLNKIKTGQKIILPSKEDMKPLEELAVEARTAVATLVWGQVRFIPVKEKRFRSLRANTILLPGDVLDVGTIGRVELILDNKSVIRLFERTKFTLQEYSGQREKSRSRFKMTLGRFWANVSTLLAQDRGFELNTPTAIVGVHGTIYNSVLRTDGLMTVEVYNGEVEVRKSAGEDKEKSGEYGPKEVKGPTEVSLETWVKLIKANQKITITKDGVPSEPKDFNPDASSNSWVKWNRERDEDWLASDVLKGN